MKKVTSLMTGLGVLLALSIPYAAAQERAEADVYKDWYNAYYTTKDLAKAYEFAKEYINKFATGANIKYVKPSRSKIRREWFNKAFTEKNIGEEIRIAKEEFAENGEDLDYLYLVIVDIRTKEMEASPANYSRSAEASEFIQKAVSLIEGGKPSQVIKPEQVKAAHAYLVQTHAMVEGKNKNAEKALELYKKSSSIDPLTGILNAQNYLAIGLIYQSRYLEAEKEFDKLPEDKKNNADDPATKAALDKLNVQADLVLDAWARFLVIPDSTKWGKVRTDVETTVKDLYKFRHDDKMDAYDEWLAKPKPNSSPSTASSTSN